MINLLDIGKVTPHNFSPNGKLMVQLFEGNEEFFAPVCRKKLDQHFLYVYKEWSGNGFGSVNFIIVWDCKRKEAYIVDSHYSFTDTVNYLKQN